MSDDHRIAEAPPRAYVLPGFVSIPDAVSLVRAAASRRDPANLAKSVADLHERRRSLSRTGKEWNAAWHTVRQALLEGSITAFECDHRGDVVILTPDYWSGLFEAAPDANDPYGLRRRDRIEPSAVRDWKSPTGVGRYVVDLVELQRFIGQEFPATSKTATHVQARAGRKKEFDEIAIICEAANIMLVQPRAKRPKSREELIERLIVWYGLNYPRAPDRSTVQPWVSKFWAHFDFDND